MKTVYSLTTSICVLCAASAFAAGEAPSSAYDLKDWKLQIPGPREVRNLTNYSSDYLHLGGNGEMVFRLDAAEKGTTPNAHFVRSELRHLQNWDTAGTHTLSADVRVSSRLHPDKVTVLQIHGITRDGKDAPPLLRIAVNDGDLVAMVKTTGDGDRNDTIILKKGLGSDFEKLEVTVSSGQLQIRVNDQKKLDRSLAFWKFRNYFKAGCYPQATEGTVDVKFRALSVN